MKITLTLIATLLVLVVYGEPDVNMTVAPLDLEEAKKELTEIINLIPRDNITAIVNYHLANDDGFKAAILHMQTPEFRALVDSIRANPKWKAFKDAVRAFGFDVDQLIECTRTFIEDSKVGDVDPSAKKSLASFIRDIEEVIPVGQMLMTFAKKKNLQSFIQHMSTNGTKEKVMDVLKVPEVKKYIEELSDMGLDVQDMLSLLFAGLGWGNLKMP
ncbi:unnamed protein product [Acanthoscelides obtectus]|uniref:Protein G12 n=1 Tax=Acanthoscelides obtectus TaxID=200917 RepID=A0A9P0KLI4_ACAOB|nr:unnamed protein product [Acanthoscelides obtectus]CAK1646399.1 hypothetical protein AOBTE_LOCUS14612 [Acanthoscelides obtectus]